jgi:hypothetical protein
MNTLLNRSWAWKEGGQNGAAFSAKPLANASRTTEFVAMNGGIAECKSQFEKCE